MGRTTGALAALAARSIGGAVSPAGARGRLAVFGYHQVLERKDALRHGEPTPGEFASDLEIIKRLFNVLPLGEAVRRLQEGSLPARAACITFDDGYANNHDLAAPALEAAGLPATFFVATGAIDEGIMWNDLVLEAVARCREPFVIADESLRAAVAIPGAAEGGASLGTRLLQALKYRPLAERAEAAARLYRDNVGGEPPRLMMTRDGVAALAQRGFAIGGHTVQHPILTRLPDADARLEIDGCSRWIEQVTGQRPTEFAYPNGRPGTDFTPAHAAMVQDAGYDCAVSTEWGIARRGADPFTIPRIGSWWRHNRRVAAGVLRLYGKSLLSAEVLRGVRSRR